WVQPKLNGTKGISWCSTTSSTLVRHASEKYVIVTWTNTKRAIASELWLAQMPPDKDAVEPGPENPVQDILICPEKRQGNSNRNSSGHCVSLMIHEPCLLRRPTSIPSIHPLFHMSLVRILFHLTHSGAYQSLGSGMDSLCLENGTLSEASSILHAQSRNYKALYRPQPPMECCLLLLQCLNVYCFRTLNVHLRKPGIIYSHRRQSPASLIHIFTPHKLESKKVNDTSSRRDLPRGTWSS
ncbi:hypothetical protein CVT26_004850, partial [Gymnopilus dilepis]